MDTERPNYTITVLAINTRTPRAKMDFVSLIEAKKVFDFLTQDPSFPFYGVTLLDNTTGEYLKMRPAK